jgi:RND family efflux transporter MFP subunit
MSEESTPDKGKRAGGLNRLARLSKTIDNKLNSLNLPKFVNSKLLFVILILILFWIIISFFSSSTTKSDLLTFKVERKNFTASITEAGELRAKKSISVAAPRIRGTLKIIYLIPEGTIVSPGDTVVKFDPSEALINVKDAKASLDIAYSEKKKLVANQTSSMAQMESQLKSAELSFELSKLELEQIKFEADVKQRQTNLQHQKNELSYLQTKQEYESKKIIQEAELAKMELEISQKQGDLDKAQNDLARLILIAPAPGLVIYGQNWSNQGKKFAVGDQPWRGASIIKLPDLSQMESVTFVNEVDVSKVKVGQEVLVTLDAYQDSSFAGSISDIAAVGKNKDNNQNIKVFEVLADIIDKSEILRPGMTTSNKVLISEVPDVLFIPHEAIFNKEDKYFAYVINGSSYDEIEIKLGAKSEDFMVVKEGLEEGDLVALEDPTDESATDESSNESSLSE